MKGMCKRFEIRQMEDGFIYTLLHSKYFTTSTSGKGKKFHTMHKDYAFILDALKPIRIYTNKQGYLVLVFKEGQ